MFEHIVIRRAEGGSSISAGRIAEALLYYQKVHLVIDRGTLSGLIRQIGMKSVLALLRRSEVSAVYCEELLVTKSESVGVTQYHNLVEMTFVGHKSIGKFKNPQDRLRYELEREGIPKSDASNFSRLFFDLVPLRKFSGDYFLKGGIAKAAKRDLIDVEYAREAFRQAVAITPGGYLAGDDLKLEVIDTERGMVVFLNIDLTAINQRREKIDPSIGTLSIAHLLTNILEARADLALSSFYGGDFVTSAVTSSIIQVKHAELLRRSIINETSLKQFSEIILPDSPCLAEVIDSGEQSFDDFLKLLDRAARFKDWLKSVNPDEGLIKTYMRDVASEGWIQKLPAKSLRYMFTTALGATNPVTSLVSGFADTFLVEKLLAGWRPNHFVMGKLSPFVKGY
ncbi:MAG: hypothetical protein M0P59_05970 [Gallionella sp.]|jgi:hypothetical protein|nr:hypothetical protein [Gallionella sp.]MCK9353690.1 hypothetical protein [Gallionella sp.]